jgi:P2 family phage contractile tail tube protein
MASQTPRILKNFTAFVNGAGMAGRVDSVELPEIELETEEHRSGGMDAKVEIDMGMKPMTTKLTISDPDPNVLALVGNSNANSARLVIRGSFVRDSDGSRVAAVAEIGGRFKKGSFGKWEAGSKAPQEYEMTVNYYKLTMGGRDIYEIDVENMLRIIDGVDQLAGIRADLGLA